MVIFISMIRLTKILKEVLRPDEIEMVNGIIDMLNQVKDLKNRKAMALDRLKDFKQSGIKVDGREFLNRCGLEEGVCLRKDGESDEDFLSRCGNAGFWNKNTKGLDFEVPGKHLMQRGISEGDINKPSPKLRPEPSPGRHEIEHPPYEKGAFKRLDPFKAPTTKK